jgi:hypothetical protein
VKVQDVALNGAQMASLQAIVQSVASGQLPAASAIALVRISIPSVDAATAAALINPSIGFTAPAVPQAAPVEPPVVPAEEPPAVPGEE